LYLVRKPSTRMGAQEHRLSCGAACARQVLMDEGVIVTEAEVRRLAGFHEELGIYADRLGDALTTMNTARPHRSGAVDPSSLPSLLDRSPFLAMIDSHWIIVDGATSAGALMFRDPAPSIEPSRGTEGVMLRAEFLAAWACGMYQVVYRI
jgi:hypothetical protein